ncbi:MAG: riboflavin biosynthesis protein RibF, partial [Nitrospiraceae bacterium]
RLAGFQEAGIEEVVILEFNKAFAALTPEEFVREILRDGVGVKELFVGEQFAFGRNRAGKIADLRRLGEEAGIRVHAVPAVRMGGEMVSATRIRTLVQAGEVRRAAQFLGRPYAISGVVVQGEHRGQALGWPTANLRLPSDRAIPADGVYAAITIWNKRAFASVSYIGTRPTFGTGERLLEVYLLDEQVDLYDQQIRVEFIDRLRGDLIFHSAEELSARIQQDILQARKTLRVASGT